MKNRDRDMVKVSPKASKVLFKNAQIRVVQVVLQPKQKLPMHSHDSLALWLALTPATIIETQPGGKTKKFNFKAGQGFWHGSRVHSMENTGTTPYRSLAVELKIKGLKGLKELRK
jgi:quercetin dioxygenase-like cupin family protein